MRVLITGGAGFIGSTLARQVRAQGWRVRVLDDLSTGSLADLDGVDADVVLGSVLDPRALTRATQGTDAVVHLAAVASVPASIADPRRTHEVNATGTLLVLEEARRQGVGQVVVASSSAVYGLNPTPSAHEREWVRPLSPYAASKLAAEQYALAYQQSYGLTTTAYRFFNVFGPRQRADHVYAAVVPRFVEALLEGRPVTVFGDGRTTRDFTYVGSLCDVLVRTLAGRLGSAEPLNLAFGTSTSLLDLIAALEQLLGRRADVRFAPARTGDVRHSRADNRCLQALLPDVVPLSLTEGLAATVDWHRRVRTRRRPAA